MKLVALVSGGKDSTYNMLQCVAAGHEIVALANLYPETKQEIDSYMYQSVGFEGIDLYAKAMNLPLYRRATRGQALNQDRQYISTLNDEVEDLYELLKEVKDELNVEGVSVGAILSSYQRVRVEHVCSRLGLTSFGYLWKRDQGELLEEMIDCRINAIVIKVAALGLDPKKHLGLDLIQMKSHLYALNDQYGSHICGEGGEYETFTLDCPLFRKSICIDEFEIVNSLDPVAPVGYIRFKKMSLIDKSDTVNVTSMIDLLESIPVKRPCDYIIKIDDTFTENPNNVLVEKEYQMVVSEETTAKNKDYGIKDLATIVINENDWCWIGSVKATNKNIADALTDALEKIMSMLLTKSLTLQDVLCLTMYIGDMSEYSILNEVYKKYFNHPNPPIRACVQTILPKNMPVLLEVIGKKSASETADFLHVQSVSHWAPANIGPYSQAVKVNSVIYVAGVIPLVPGTMNLLNAGIREQCNLTLRHVHRVIEAMETNANIESVVMGYCFVTRQSDIDIARVECEQQTKNALIDYIVVSKLPRDASIELFVWAHCVNKSFEYEETSCVLNNYHYVSLKRRWHYDHSVSAVICHILSSSKNTFSDKTIVDEGFIKSAGNIAQTSFEGEHVALSEATLTQAVNYILSKLLFQENRTNCGVVSFKVFYVVSVLSAAVLENVFEKFIVEHRNLVPTLIPVISLQNQNTIVSICAMSQCL